MTITRRRWIYLLVTTLIFILVALYTMQANFYKTHFLPKTTINGLAVGRMPLSKVEKMLYDEEEKGTFKILNGEKVWKEVHKKELGIETDFKPGLHKILDSQNKLLWITSLFKPTTLSIAASSLNEDGLDDFTKSLEPEIKEFNKDKTPSVNATIISEEEGLAIKKESYGNDISYHNLSNSLKEAVRNGIPDINLQDYVALPELTTKSPELKELLTKANDLVDQKATYLINGKSITIPKKELVKWVTVDQKEKKVGVNQDIITKYVTELGEKYNTSTVPTEFKSTKRGTVSVPAGTYSWTIQTDDEAKALAADFLAGKGIDRSPISVGSASSGPALIGDTYVEVDLKNQHMYFYKEGKTIIDTDIVSGKPKTPTPPGVHYLWNKESPSILRGKNDDGSDYAAPVDFWMPIDWTGVGLHDSNWQPVYGGARWKDGFGSHGCINTPPDLAAKLYSEIEINTPVIVF
ncbi:L,D-transpeptidase family protein [Vagococcus fessus]|uniref:L,D-TPase catalytic domain-containing protein n=1 Tax=Vagococcus fessus TaxID=120370 RepID=A0A430A412_9ENTE|nr:L,D-transpeptidase family protein [Vagococcus fessus]RSU01351.1 hypothetical protein CBF31_10915 [Vagococcus fessus]